MLLNEPKFLTKFGSLVIVSGIAYLLHKLATNIKADFPQKQLLRSEREWKHLMIIPTATFFRWRNLYWSVKFREYFSPPKAYTNPYHSNPPPHHSLTPGVAWGPCGRRTGSPRRGRRGTWGGRWAAAPRNWTGRWALRCMRRGWHK